MMATDKRIQSDRTVRADKIVSLAAECYGVTDHAIRSQRRTAAVVAARHLAIYLVRQRIGWSFPEIGEYIGRDHRSVMHAFHKVANLCDPTHPAYDRAVVEVVRLVTRWLGPAR